MSSEAYRFTVGEEVIYPQILLINGRHKVVERPWQIKAIFPVSELALLAQTDHAGPQMHVKLNRLSLYN